MTPLPLLSDSDLLNILALSQNATAIYTTEDLIIQSANDAMLMFWSKGRNVIGLRLEDAVPPLKDNPLLQLLKNVWRTGVDYDAKDVPADIRVNGELQTTYFDLKYRAIKNSSGEIYCILHTARNVSDLVHKRAEVKALQLKTQQLNEELTAFNEELSTMNEELSVMNEELTSANEEQQLANDALVIADQKAKLLINDAPIAIGTLLGKRLIIESANTELLNLWKQDGDIIGKPIADILPERTKGALIEILEDVFETGNVFYGDEIKSHQKTFDGTTDVYFNFIYHPIKDENGQTVSIMVVASEVTEQIEARKAIEHSEYRLNQMITTSPVGMTILRGTELIIENANKPMLELWMRGRDIIGKQLYEVFPERLNTRFPALLNDVFLTGKSFAMAEVPVTMTSGDGVEKEIFVSFSYSPLFDANGKVESIVATVIVVTEAVLARKKIEESTRLQQTLNEELAATNEEYEATNEQLVMANEEFTVLNEELNATNEELQIINEEVIKARNTLDLAIDAAGIIIWTAQLGTGELTISENGNGLFEIGGAVNITLQDFLSRIADGHRAVVTAAIDNAIKTKTRLDLEFQIKATSLQRLRWFKFNAIPYYNLDGLPSQITGTMLDITEQKQDDQRKNDFIAMVSHELKTPLTSLKAYVQMLAAKAHKIEDRFSANALDKANSQVNKMTGLINGFLNLSRLESGKISLNKQPFLLDALVKEILDETVVTTATHHLVFEPTCEVTVSADRDKIGSVISNFISNGIKYSQKGTLITIGCDIVNGAAQISVKDAGIGINQADLNRLFERFYRVEGKQTETISGFGIGLYLSSEIIQRHEGKIWVESEANKGSVFYFTLPL